MINKLNYDKIKENFDFNDLFQSQTILNKLGIEVTLDKEASSKSIKQYRINGNERVVVYERGNTGYPFYTNQSNESDKGDVIQFIANRLEISDGSGNYEAAKLIMESTNELSGLSPLVEREGRNVMTKRFVLEDFKKKGLKQFEKDLITFLTTQRGINPNLFQHPNFVGLVFIYFPFLNNKSVHNIFFAKKDRAGNIIGAEIKFPKSGTTQNTNIVEGNPIALWYSNRPSVVEKVILCESALDCLSHFQVNMDANVLYVSSNGNLYKERITSFYELLEALEVGNDVPIMLAGDNDFGGVQYDLRMANSEIGSNRSFELMQEKGKVSLIYSDFINNQDVIDEVRDYFHVIKIKINNVEMAEKPFLNHFVEISNHTSSVQLDFPKEVFERHARKISISLFETISILKETRLFINKPNQSKSGMIKDWNDYSLKFAEEQAQNAKSRKQTKNKNTP